MELVKETRTLHSCLLQRWSALLSSSVGTTVRRHMRINMLQSVTEESVAFFTVFPYHASVPSVLRASSPR